MQLASLASQALQDIASASTLDALESLRVAFLGKKGAVTEAMKALGGMSAEERKSFGASVNQTKQEITDAIDARKAVLAHAALAAKLATETMDVSLAPIPALRGAIHPISQVLDEITAIFADMGLRVATGPDIEDDFHNFTALNIPEHHPARQMHDTFYLKAQAGTPAPVLRTHTSPVQIRTMLGSAPPHRIIAPGCTFRSDSDATHTPMFHQVEGLVIDKNIHMGHLKGCLEQFLMRFFEIDSVPIRFRNSFFPFTEPSAEVDIGCDRSGGTVKIGAGKGWLEVLGCGMVHPAVLTHCKIDPNEWQGFAFGMGVERLAMLKYGMSDLRQFFEGDIRWLQHYGFSPLFVPSLTGGLS
jgi:phenylalanyl-tRNA synthetase alpha chain